MGCVKESPFYQQAIQELTYSFGTYYLFDCFVVAEVNEGVVFTWDDHAKKVVEDISNLYDQDGKEIVYISNRIYSYSVMPSDWIKFYKNNYKLKGYAVVSYTPKGVFGGIIEKLFVKNSFKTFEGLEDAIKWARSL